MRIAILTSDGREVLGSFAEKQPSFGTAPEALLQGMAETSGLEVHVVSCLQQPVLSPEKIAPNIFYHGLHVPKIGWMRTGYQGCIRAVRKKLKQIQPDIVHGQGTERDCAISAIFSGFPNVITIHGNMAEMARLFQSPIGSFGWLAAKLEDFTLRRTAGVFCNSAYTEQLVQPRARQTWRVANPIRQQFFSSPIRARNLDKCVILNIGVISERKRQIELLQLARKLHQQGILFELQFIGAADPSSGYATTFLNEIKDVEKAGFARYLGCKSTSELIGCFDGASALIHFPNEEAFGLVVAEALARNLKFFGSRVGGIPDIAAAAEGAELFPENDWDGLGAAVIKWTEQGRSGPKQAAELMRQRYHPKQITQRHLKIYQEVLSKNK